MWARNAAAGRAAASELWKWDGVVESKTGGRRVKLNAEASRRLLGQVSPSGGADGLRGCGPLRTVPRLIPTGSRRRAASRNAEVDPIREWVRPRYEVGATAICR